ncbi:MAG: Xaa-Pro dipeptidase [Pseudomonadota bacterium]
MSDLKSERYRQHIDRLLEQSSHIVTEQGYDRLLIHSGRPRLRFQDDHSPAFRAHPYFVHWVPLVQHVDGLIEIQPGRRPILYLTLPDDYWHARPVEPEPWWADQFDIQIGASAEAWRPRLDDARATALIAEPGDVSDLGRHISLNPAPLLWCLDEQRTVKTEWQIDCMRSANERAVAGHQAAERAFAQGCSELDIHLAYLKAAQHDPDALPYGSIVALNEHAAILHYQYLNASPPARRYSFLIDAGADCLGYAADITRTYVANEAPDAVIFKDLLQGMDRLQLQLADAAMPGVEYVDLNDQAHRGVAELMDEAGLCDLSIDAMLGRGLTGRFLPHGLGHHIGVQVHDVGGRTDAEGRR